MRPTPMSPSEFPSSPSVPPSAVGSSVSVPAARWQAITADLAARGVTGPVTLVSARSVTWPNGALGCPKPGVMYTQALVDGLQVVVEVAGKRYDYRFGRSDSAKLCENPGPLSSPSDR